MTREERTLLLKKTCGYMIDRIRFGMTREDVLSVFGEPDNKNIGSRKYPRPTIWLYAGAEFNFEYSINGKLYRITYPFKCNSCGERSIFELKEGKSQIYCDCLIEVKDA